MPARLAAVGVESSTEGDSSVAFREDELAFWPREDVGRLGAGVDLERGVSVGRDDPPNDIREGVWLVMPAPECAGAADGRCTMWVCAREERVECRSIAVRG